jgi:endopeptidase La
MNQELKFTIVNKISRLKHILINIVRSNQYYKKIDIINSNDLNSCIIYSEVIIEKINILLEKINNNLNQDHEYKEYIDELQTIVFKISTLINLYGCDTLENFIYICIGNNFSIEDKYKLRYNLLNNYFRPIRYKLLDWKSDQKIDDDILFKNSDNFDCFNIDNCNNNFQVKIFGLKIVIHNIDNKNTIVIYGIIEDTIINLIDNTEIFNKLNELKKKIPICDNYNDLTYNNFIDCLSIKDLLILTYDEIHNNYIEMCEDYNQNILKTSITDIINNFIKKELIDKRNMLIMLLVNSHDNEGHYLAYLLYDLLSIDINGIIDTYEQTTIYDSLIYNIKKKFQDAMKCTVNYSKTISKTDNNLSLEQRICLMKTNNNVKEKALIKLKEVKMKSEDSGSKAMQYIEGLLKIPFGIYKKEHILTLVPSNIKIFTELVERLNMELYNNSKYNISNIFPIKQKYTIFEVNKYCSLLQNDYIKHIQQYLLESFKTYICSISKPNIIKIYSELKNIINEFNYTIILHKFSNLNLNNLRKNIIDDICKLLEHNETDNNIYLFIEKIMNMHSIPIYNNLITQLPKIENNLLNVQSYMKSVSTILDKSVYGHNNAKKQIERIIGQWLNGDLSGYSIGFEGPPGVGKTSLAKNGISRCLNDENGISRPFSFIAMGGSTNSSTIDGHNYTYVGSTWGRIVDILMDTKIMNPIIFIDELDKVSKTENGKEIIGILTHLIDQTQNDTFQDKYFNGVNIDLSKALFIFSYNDAELIDRILLDRIHRIKFDNLSLYDKVTITREFILPEICSKMGLTDIIHITDDVIIYIIINYTCEPGVRKLKEIIFEIMGGINIDILKNNISDDICIPINITIDNIKLKYLKNHDPVKTNKIHTESSIGVINGLWANSLGNGGLLPIEATFCPSNSYLELKLTGMQGDVMKESMNVAKSVAWYLYTKYNEYESMNLYKKLEETKNNGIHIHVPEGATPKDGPSAGVAITIVIYSLFTGRKIKNNIAITGEICLQGKITAIGGLELKILGGIRGGVKTFIFPNENKEDYNKFLEKYKDNQILNDITFKSVDTIEDVLHIVFID